MLGQKTKKVTITAISTTEIEGKKVVLENYTATVDSENPENMSMAMNQIRAKPQRRTLHIILKELFRKRGYANESN